jgi:hypothetical protein
MSPLSRIAVLFVGASLAITATTVPADTIDRPQTSAPASTVSKAPFRPTFVQLPANDQTSDDAQKPYDNISPCSLVWLPAVRTITKRSLLFISKRHGERLTAQASDALTVPISDDANGSACQLSSGTTRTEYWISVQTDTKQPDFFKHRSDIQTEIAGTQVQDIPSGLFTDVTQAYVVITPSLMGHRHYSHIVALTKYHQMIEIFYGAQEQSTLHKLMRSALKAFRGDYYNIDK